jgi:hypothetical protein
VTDGPPRHLTPVPPDQGDAEQAVLGAMLISTARAIADVEPELDPADFYRPAHEHIYDAILALHSTGAPVDMVTVADHLAKQRDPAARPARPRRRRPLPRTTSLAPRRRNVTYYAAIVRNHARLRAVVATGTRLTQLAYAADVDRVDAYLGEALQTLDDTVQRFGPRPGPSTSAPASSTSPGSSPAAKHHANPHPRLRPPHRRHRPLLRRPGQRRHRRPRTRQDLARPARHRRSPPRRQTAAMIDCDHNGPDASAARLLLLGAAPSSSPTPPGSATTNPRTASSSSTPSPRSPPAPDDVVLIDSLGEVFGLLGVNENHGDEVTAAMRKVCTQPAMAGACVITVDHLPKSNEARATGFAIGSIAKKRMIRGAYLRADAKQKPAPGQVGRITLRIEKDTMGELRRSSGGGYAGTLVLDSTRDYALEWSIRRESSPRTPTAPGARPTSWSASPATSRTTPPARELLSVMVKIGTTDGWCERCLDLASNPPTDALFDALDRAHDTARHVHAAECCWPFPGVLAALGDADQTPTEEPTR